MKTHINNIKEMAIISLFALFIIAVSGSFAGMLTLIILKLLNTP